MTTRYVRVAVPRPIDDSFHYQVPEKLVGQVEPGSVVVVPFGKRSLTGVVVGMADSSPVKTRNLLAITDIPPLDPGLMELARWTSRYYQTPFGLVLRMLLPPKTQGAGIKFRLTRDGKQALEAGECPFPDVLEALGRGPRTSKYLENRVKDREVEDALAGGLIETVLRLPFGSTDSPPGPGYTRSEKQITTLTEHQSNTLENLTRAIEKQSFSVTLLKGVAGSGKTEVYLRAARSALEAGRGVLLLVPEIALTPLLTSRLNTVAPGGVAVLHSGLNPGERRGAWEAVRRGQLKLVVGVRSGVFAPIPNLGLLIVDEEHDPSYRQEETPSYNARDVAVKRGQMEGIPVLLGSATPSLESFRNTETGRYQLSILPERATPSPDPVIEVINMADPKETKSTHPFLSARLLTELDETLKRGEQSILFLNRRGFAPFLLCPECNYTMTCPNCSVTLTFHRSRGMLCHYCGNLQDPPSRCPSCKGNRIAPVGTGIQRVEDALQSALPGTVVERLDRDVLDKRGALETIYMRMDSGEIQVLVGTQILAKGHDFPGVTLVGILNAEQALDFPDFRASERTFQLITQVSGRAGRGEKRGMVLVQSYAPGNYAVAAALAHDYEAFYRAETTIRQELGYPPFRRLGRVIVDGTDEQKVQKTTMNLVRRIHLPGKTRILGPSPAPLPKIQNRHRWHFLLLADTHGQLTTILSALRSDPPPGIRIHVRVDPHNLM